MESLSPFASLVTWIRESIGLKLTVIGVLGLVLLIPAGMISMLIQEREGRRYEAVAEVSSKWGGRQLISGPILQIPYQHRWQDEKGVTQHEVRMAHFLPEELRIKGALQTEVRYRGIFELVLYTATMNIEGNFRSPDFSDWKISAEDVLWNDAQLVVGVQDMKGISQEVTVSWNGRQTALEPGVSSEGVLAQAIGAKITVNRSGASPTHPFSFQLVLKGSEDLQFLPLGKTTNVHLEGAWPSPSFQGGFLPYARTVTDAGFSADWQVLNLNRAYPQQWINGTVHFVDSSFGTQLMVPVDGYQQTTRAQKYAALFIGLTFLVVFFSEITRRTKVHPFQYFLVGLAVCVFYLLLLSLSEHLSFNLSYSISAAAVTTLLTLYSRGVFKSRQLSSSIGGYCIGFYGFMFLLLQLNDYALLLGSVGVFCVLAAVMYCSGKIRWYRPLETGSVTS